MIKKCFLWCHVIHINPLKKHPERIKKSDKKIAEELDYNEIEFPIHEKDFNKIEVKNNICVNENKTFKIGENEKIIDIVERILELNSKKQLGLGLNA